MTTDTLEALIVFSKVERRSGELHVKNVHAVPWNCNIGLINNNNKSFVPNFCA